MRPPRPGPYACAAILAILCWACSSRPSRDETFALVADSPLFKKDYAVRLEFGERCDGVAVAPSSEEAYMRESHTDYVLLAEQGLLEVSDAFVVHPTWWWQKPPAICVRKLKEITRNTNEEAAVMRTYYYWTAALTDKGRRLGIPEKGGEIVIASKELQQITDLATSEDGAIEARYRWRWAPTKFGEAAPQLIEAITRKSRRSFGTARLTRDDRGWRVVAVSDTARYVTDGQSADAAGGGAPAR